MTALIITVVLFAWILSAIIRTADDRRKAARQRKAEAMRRAEAARIRQEWKEQQAAAKAETARIIALEKARIEQEKWNARQEELNRKQAEQLRKHDEQIRKLQFQMEQAQADIETERERISGLYALLDIAQAQQAAAHPGSKSDEAAQRKIITLTAQIAASEKRIRKAEHTKATAEAKLAA